MKPKNYEELESRPTKEETFGELFNFENIFRVKGKQGLVNVISYKEGAQTCVVCEIYNPKSKRSEIVSKLYCLDSLLVSIKGQLPLDMTKVFTNISNYTINSEDYAFEKVSIEELMPIMAPGYNEEEFKEHHAKKVLDWYIEITIKYSTITI